MRNIAIVLIAVLIAPVAARAADDWFNELVRLKQSDAEEKKLPTVLPDFGKGPFTIGAWIKTTGDGIIFSRTAQKGKGYSKTLFVRKGKLVFQVGRTGRVTGIKHVADGKWHHVAVARGEDYTVYVDGKMDEDEVIDTQLDPEQNVLVIGRGFKGQIDDVRIYDKTYYPVDQISRIAAGKEPRDGGLVAHCCVSAD